MKKEMKYSFGFLIIVFIVILFLPQKIRIPVQGATKSSYNQKSFWFYPWGKSGTHKGIDIFAAEGTTVLSSTYGLVLYSGEIEMGGKVVLILAHDLKIHYYAHLKEIQVPSYSLVKTDVPIGSVGTSGNALGKPPHLHYTIFTLIPYIWRMDFDREGWKKMFFLNPIDFFY
ncbi:MAG: M23 family metallopeptidase [Leptospiraceae bacterium]|nr:M23 family metallopeptidase [Leptospiraceae bacterium]